MDKFYVVNEAVTPGLSYPHVSEVRRHYFVSLKNAKEKFYEILRKYMDSSYDAIEDVIEKFYVSNWNDYFDACWERGECEDIVSWEVLFFEG